MPVAAGAAPLSTGPGGPTEDGHRDHDHEADHEAGGGHDHAHGASKVELAAAIFAAVLLVVGFFLEQVLDVSTGVARGFFVVAVVSAGWFTVQDAWSSLRARRFEIDTLMLVAAGGACVLGQWEDAALLLVLFSIGHALEGYAMNRARQAIEALADLAPPTARIKVDGVERVVPVAELTVGAVVAVRPDERIAADGFVVAGVTSVDQSAVTGESVPVEKAAVSDPTRSGQNPAQVPALSRVFAGTINGSGAIDVQVTALASESTLARVVQLVTEAETQVSPTQQKTKAFERVFVPAVLALVAVLLGAGFVVDEPFSDTFYRAMAVLVAASPCALAIATPSAVLSAVARAGRGGVLVKGGGPLEHLGRISAIAFDKTGTLTEGRPRLVDVVAADGVRPAELIAVAVAIEQSSDHPLAAAIVTGGLERLDGVPVEAATDVSSITGKGVRGLVGGEEVLIGSAALFDDDANPMPDAVSSANGALQQRARTTMVVRQGARYLGVLGVMDTPRPQAARVVTELRLLGIERMVMLSGDNQQVATSVAGSVGLTEARGDLLPEDKVTTIRELMQDGSVAMVGDGVNDAPALATASVGIAMGAAGSDVALETADVALMGDDLRSLPFVVDLSRRTTRIIRQNLWVSLGVVAVLVPTTIAGIAGIGPAVAIHEGSTLIVVANALRLLAGGSDRRQAAPDGSSPA
ncbi:heavy metal translocating P-type ATPase [Aquihabitans sp. G128]|uniref:heavy metal translocating P-type ATPase n=1 Tax=Aquihabitans sp. G128 TaxID=2849779 RepID=UPI001C244E4E|nr:heavy metal translocating P-type ATPase [Aquihabitans sp. G128]QXC60593.1 heavy metal translocating P-type ATPase [Aquihabitans sp. G128]